MPDTEGSSLLDPMADLAEEAGEETRHGLPEAVRAHLGTLLGRTYDRIGLEAGAITAPFADLLARLDSALAQAEGERDRTFRAGLLDVVPALHRFAVSLTRDPAAADDLVQDTLLRGWRGRGGFTPGTNLEAWLFTILRNVFYSQHRKQGREVADTDGNYAERLTSIPEQGGHLDLQDVRAALDRLAPVMREALVLVAIENLSYEEAAVVMNCRIGTVKSRVWRAREQLARMLGYNGTEIGSDGVMLSVTGTSA
ncbi:RNA polymerase sigma-70 factor, ECF subfamily [Methylobacterium sp. UNC378MF]|jgi:RNA polymerase sigma-70 factor, ECF subfamily|uniref:sigma-70 family RNA polymerase sigma factor n=1 Tax=Methylobacterium sp. UNC378MF TaxID=1502748 RepID=UPI00088809CA|nr:sigma-70 family RNA polymerase sigma factor [Methylobacterium sp. UNC378MF]SDA21420.1 RNA polymerase sigma-70 factor, ECF subfamily [Methylobacterium sp. UNC378MF]